MRAFTIGILVFLFITLGCVNSTSNTTPNTDAATTETTPITNIPNETTNTGTNQNTPPNENTTPPVESIPPIQTTPEATQTYTLADIATHNNASDCWTAINGKVYDLTEFVNGHPGGPGIIGACGIDGTTLFTTRNGNGPHPASATKTLEKYYIGELSAQ